MAVAVVRQPETILPTGTSVRTHDVLGKTTGMMNASPHLAARTPDAAGTIQGCVPGHGGDVYWVTHGDGIAAAYCFTEFELDEGGVPVDAPAKPFAGTPYGAYPEAIARALHDLDVALCEHERLAGWGSTLILVPHRADVEPHVSLDGKPVPDDVEAIRAMEIAMLSRRPS